MDSYHTLVYPCRCKHGMRWMIMIITIIIIGKRKDAIITIKPSSESFIKILMFFVILRWCWYPLKKGLYRDVKLQNISENLKPIIVSRNTNCFIFVIFCNDIASIKMTTVYYQSRSQKNVLAMCHRKPIYLCVLLRDLIKIWNVHEHAKTWGA